MKEKEDEIKYMKKIKCPKCHSTHVIPLEEAEVVNKTSLNLNPLHPFTLVNTKKKKKKVKTDEISLARTAAVVASGGLLAPVTGVHKKRKGAHVWFCQDCGCEFTKKIQ